MPHSIDGIALDSSYAYADAVRCPGSRDISTFASPSPHAGPRRLTYSGRGFWGCTGCGRLFNSAEVREEQSRQRSAQASREAAR